MAIGEGPFTEASLTVIGGGLAGSEAAWQAAEMGIRVVLFEMRPQLTTPAHQTDRLAELVCSNSLGSNLPDRASGILKQELRLAGSLIIACADRTAVPAGGALAVGREQFSSAVTAAILGHPNITLVREEMGRVPPNGAVIIASGPLTSPALSGAIREMAGQQHLHFFDAMAPIVSRDSIDMTVAFRASRYSRASEEGAGDYINCPFDREQYYSFVSAISEGESAVSHVDAELPPTERSYFEGCLPVEVLARRSPDALAFGPMRPVGLWNPHTGHRPFAVVQLRQDDAADTLYNIVGFQTSLRWGDQERILRMIPGLAHAEFVRFGQMHRNTFLDSPALLRSSLQWHSRDDLFFAGQIIGTEGYVGSTASGLIAGMNAARILRGLQPIMPPPETMSGALVRYVTGANVKRFQPMKANLGLLAALEGPPRDKRLRKLAHATRSREAIAEWLAIHRDETASAPTG